MISYSVYLTRHDADGGQQVIEIEHYGLLRELLDDLEREAGVNLWFEDDATPAAPAPAPPE